MFQKRAWCFILFFLFFAQILLAEERVLRMGHGEGISLELKGFFDNLYEEAGYSLDWIRIPTLRQYPSLREGVIDLLPYVPEDALIEKLSGCYPLGFGSAPFLAYPLWGYVERSRGAEFQDTDGLRGKRILYLLGREGHVPRIEGIGAIPVRATTMETAMKMLIHRRGDIILSAPFALEELLEKSEYRGEIIPLLDEEGHVRVLAQVKYYHLLGPHMNALAPEIREILQDRRSEWEALLAR